MSEPRTDVNHLEIGENEKWLDKELADLAEIVINRPFVSIDGKDINFWQFAKLLKIIDEEFTRE